MTLMVAIDDAGVLAHDFGPGGYNAEKFEQFLEVKLFSTLDRRRTIVLDNARFHKTDAGFVKKLRAADADGLLAYVNTTIERVFASNTIAWIRDIHRNVLIANAGQSLRVFFSNQDHLLEIEAAHYEERPALQSWNVMREPSWFKILGRAFGGIQKL
ncbi:hypothetical protein K457DRAFT_25210 [Linnemannia elongata AG-77]|uniref:Tc1-like transposase DDE domain-containing protein n=1 Tax=Linnemannia elongata AG-77 TaxID=1314771 RepID=A0A197JDY1_9FUNG|nr:hypothetical protein K457DRAFT_25210 [Linnemannia elongata AG-77]